MWPMLSPCVFMFEIKMCNLYSWTLLVFKRNRFKSTDNIIISKIRARFRFFFPFHFVCSEKILIELLSDTNTITSHLFKLLWDFVLFAHFSVICYI